MSNFLFLLLGGGVLAAGLTMRKTEGADPRLANLLLGLGVVLMSVSIILSGISIGRS